MAAFIFWILGRVEKFLVGQQLRTKVTRESSQEADFMRKEFFRNSPLGKQALLHPPHLPRGQREAPPDAFACPPSTRLLCQ